MTKSFTLPPWGVLAVGAMIMVPSALAAIRLDVGPRNVQVAEITPGADIRRDKQEVLFNEPDSDFDLPLRCKPAQGKLLTLTDDEKWAACCPPGTRLLGTINTAFDCCGEGHDLAGSKDTGWTCCLSGYEYDGTKCKDPKPLCPNGMELVDGKCICPPGTTQAADGTCKPNTANGGNGNGGNQAGKHPSGPCSSEISSDGQRRVSRFQQAVINPGDPIRILDLHGEPNSGKDPNQWLNNAQNGGHIARTPKFEDAGVFTISKWTEGKYCISGLETGVGPTCPSDSPALTFNTLDTESCLPLELVTVPCNIRDPNNNCLWSGNQQKPCPTGFSCLPNGQSPGQFPSGQSPGGQNPGSQSPGGQSSGSQFPGGQFPGGQFPGGYFPNGQNPGDRFPGGQNPGGQFPGGEFPSGQIPGGQFPGGQFPGSQFPDGQNPGGQNPGCRPTPTGTLTPGGGATPTCPPGQPWKDGTCVIPITDCADRAHPEFGDTSYNPANFPCSIGRERPCRGEQVQDWKPANLPWTSTHRQPGPPQPYETTINFDFDVIMSIVDVETQSEHFLVNLDGTFWGETGGERGYKNQYIGNYNDPEWCLLNGYTRGYFLIPKGQHTLTIEWPQGTGKYQNDGGGNWWYGIARYRFDKLCDPSRCLPDCAVEKEKEAQQLRLQLQREGKWPSVANSQGKQWGYYDQKVVA
ncbi:Putative protein of unknown function [Podospora comata]|uniref:Uncharacterized protein n=1 Tax=Podospora comata TaxID=48703 RepID=A0ABY6SB31_PODCO|nr:Putative protein of unknown function [Podospora comata]